jgi:activator of HSP90 ATPase
VYEILMDSDRHGQATGLSASIDRRVGGAISAGDGYISGQNVELVEDERIVQRWRGWDWPDGHLSTVTIEMREVADGTELTLTHVGVPEEEGDMVEEGWHKHYWRPIIRFLHKERSADD